ncbi:serine/threonine protein kinase [Hyalangium gracile]|uniref:serine/threonine protein kinase n=1 Tax=Hyalangium gracile TaxID=394092 RepID=UPI001CCF08EC|nr:serine/threonine-protein kinase [Hyalangium gracile]
MRDQETFFEPPAPEPGDTLDSWLVLERLDSGAYGVVYRVHRSGHPEAGDFALKLARKVWDARFEREADLLQRIQHPSVPRFEDTGFWTSPRGHRYPYLVMELVVGSTLYEWAMDPPPSSVRVMLVLAQVARAIDAVHSVGAVHRDVKGDNIRVTPDDRAFLVDFGSGWLPNARPLTDTTAPPGTTPYRAPEVLRFMWRFRRDPDARWRAQASDDLYALGVTAYRLVTGTYPPPVIEEEPRKLLPPSELATVAPALEAIILRLLSEDREARGTAREIAEALDRALSEAGPAGHRAIVPTAAAAPTEEGVPPPSRETRSSTSRRSNSSPTSEPERSTPQGAFPIWLSWASAAMVGGLVAAVILVMLDWGRPALPQPEALPQQVTQRVQEEKPDAGTAGLGDVAAEDQSPTSLQDTPTGGVLPAGIGRQMPPSPFNGQRKPPCEPRMETAIRGGCWILIGRMEAPCGAKAFEWEGLCYSPSFDAPKQPTSGEP